LKCVLCWRRRRNMCWNYKNDEYYYPYDFFFIFWLAAREPNLYWSFGLHIILINSLYISYIKHTNRFLISSFNNSTPILHIIVYARHYIPSLQKMTSTVLSIYIQIHKKKKWFLIHFKHFIILFPRLCHTHKTKKWHFVFKKKTLN
jgi:hypothetical protein